MSRERSNGNVKANPLEVALIEQGAYELSRYTGKKITLMDISARRRYTGIVPPNLAEYVTGFRHNVRVLQDREFELVLLSVDG